MREIIVPKGSIPTDADIQSLLNKWTIPKRVKCFDF